MRITILMWLLLIPIGVSNANRTWFCEAPPENKVLTLFAKLCIVESECRPHAYNKAEKATGIIQIRPIMIREVNSLGHNFTIADAYSITKSYAIFKIFQDRFNPTHDEEIGARMWNGGRRGHLKQSTIKYYNKVKKILL